MIITEGLKRRFAKDTNLPIKIFAEPYFSHFLDLYEAQFGARTKYNEFCKMLENFSSEQDYFEEYNRVKDAAITYLTENPAMQHFCNNEDMSRFKITNVNLPAKDIYKDTNVGKYFVSIDMVKANFTSLRHYDPRIVDHKTTYEEFLGLFTDEKYLQNSKYIRQVIWGNMNPRRQIAYEKYLMDQALSIIFESCKSCINCNHVAYFGTDEIVLDITDFVSNNEVDGNLALNLVDAQMKIKAKHINVRMEFFQLWKVKGTDGYMRKFDLDVGGKQYDLKCITSLEMPFVIRAINGEVPKLNDFVFSYEGKLARFLEPIKVEFTTNPTK